jgi:hypothetical protein
MPWGCFSGGKKSGSTLATAIRAFGTQIRTFFDNGRVLVTRTAVGLFSGGKVGFFLSESQVADSGAVDWCETG